VVQTVPPTAAYLLDPHLRLRESEERLRLALWAARMATWEWDVVTGTVSLTGALGTITGLRPGLPDLPSADLYPSQIAAVHPDDRARVAAAAHRTVEAGADYTVEFRVTGKDGAVRWLADQGRVLERDAAGRARRVAGVVMEVTERRNLQDQLAHQASHDALTGLPNRTLFRRRLADALVPAHLAGIAVRPLPNPSHSPFDPGPPTASHHRDPARASAVIPPRPTPSPTITVFPLDPIPPPTPRPLDLDSGFPVASTAVAVLYLDLDGFKGVNDRLGHEAGDRLLVAVGERLRGVLRTGDTVSRLGGDEFAVLLASPIDLDAAGAVADRVIRVLGGPYTLTAGAARVSASVGVAMAIPGHSDADTVLHWADTALLRAKRAGKATYAVFDPVPDPDPGHTAPARAAARARDRAALAADLRGAVAHDQLRLAYQPEIDLTTGEIVGLEALPRWARPGATGELLDPADFLGLAEETGLIVEIGYWVLAEACRRLAGWHARLRRPGGGLFPEGAGVPGDVGGRGGDGVFAGVGPPHDPRDAGRGPLALPFVSVNLSPRQVRDPGLAATIGEILTDTGAPPACLQLELGGEALRGELDAAAFTLRELRQAGVRIAIDGFGIGGAGLSILRDVPVDAVKLDRSFTARAGDGRRDAAIVRSVVALTAEFGQTVTATGIESAAQRTAMHALGCTHGQGHALYPPLSPEEIGAVLA